MGYKVKILMMLLLGGCSEPPQKPLVTENKKCPPEIVVAKTPDQHTSIEARLYPAVCATFLQGEFWGGTDVPPRKLIGSLVIDRNGSRFLAPVSAFADLADPATFAIERGEPLRVRIEGQGESRYVAIIDVAKGHVVERRVTYPGFEQEVIEITKFAKPIE